MPRRTFLKLSKWSWMLLACGHRRISGLSTRVERPEIRLCPQARMLLKRGIKNRERTRKWENEKRESTLALSVTLLPILCVVSRFPFCSSCTFSDFRSAFDPRFGNIQHYSCPRSVYCRSIVFLLVVWLFEIYHRFIMKIFTHISYNRWDNYRK